MRSYGAQIGHDVVIDWLARNRDLPVPEGYKHEVLSRRLQISIENFQLLRLQFQRMSENIKKLSIDIEQSIRRSNMRKDVPPPNTACQIKNCSTVAKTYVGKNSDIPVCGLHAAIYRAKATSTW